MLFQNDFITQTGNAAERREAAERRRLQRAAEREKLLAAQSSTLHAPQQRIELWERLHAMHLPRKPDHLLVRVIAVQTALTIRDVQDEQLRRAGASAAPIDGGG